MYLLGRKPAGLNPQPQPGKTLIQQTYSHTRAAELPVYSDVQPAPLNRCRYTFGKHPHSPSICS